MAVDFEGHSLASFTQSSPLPGPWNNSRSVPAPHSHCHELRQGFCTRMDYTLSNGSHDQSLCPCFCLKTELRPDVGGLVILCFTISLEVHVYAQCVKNDPRIIFKALKDPVSPAVSCIYPYLCLYTVSPHPE